MKNKLLRYMLLGVLIVSVVGSLWHFVYQLTGNNAFVGLFAPVNESVWEHMKLLFFPMLFYSLPLAYALREEYPCMLSGLLLGNLVGTLSIPVMFYTYSGALGIHSLVVDILIFLLSVFLAFFIAYRLTKSCNAKNMQLFLIIATILFMGLFFVFTYYPPNIPLFAVP